MSKFILTPSRSVTASQASAFDDDINDGELRAKAERLQIRRWREVRRQEQRAL